MVVEISTSIPEPILAFLIVFAPFFLILGIKGFADWITTFIKVRQGYFSVNWIMKNHQWKEKMIKPAGNEVKVEGKPIPFINNPEFTAFRGSRKILFFSRIGERLKQLQIKADSDADLKKNKGVPPENEFNEMLDAAFSAGTVFGLKKSSLERILLYAAVIVGAGALIFGFVNMGMLNTMDGRLNATQGMIPTADAVADKVVARLTPVTIPINYTIPSNATVIRG
jgi:hypothetical protein